MAGEGDNENVQFALNLDGEQFQKEIGSAQAALGQLAESAGLPTAAFGDMLASATLVTAAVLAFKAAVDMVETAEEVKAVNAQFDILATNAGLAGDKLKEDLIKASGGLADEVEILKSANKAIISMGESAYRLPEIMELARKSSQLTGASLIDSFNSMSFAIENGNKRALKQYGIYVDNAKAVRDYANAHGVAIGTLTEEAKRQAIMNAAIDAGNKAMAGVQTNLRETSDSITKANVSFKELGQAISMAFSKLAGPALSSLTQSLARFAHDATTALKATFGDGTEKTNAQLEQMKLKLEYLNNVIAQSAAHPGFYDAQMVENLKRQREEIEKLIAAKTKDNAVSAESPKGAKVYDEAAGPSPAAVEIQDQKKLLESKKKFDSEYDALRKAQVTSQLNNIQTEKEAQELFEEQQLLLARKHADEIAKIDADELLNNDQKNQLKIQAEASMDAQMKAMEEDLMKYKIQASENALRNAQTVGSQMSASAQLNAQKAADSWKKSGGIGAVAMNAFQSSAVKGFQAAGKEGAHVGEELKNAMLASLGDIASAQGQFMMLDAFKTFPAVNVPEFAAGGALVALGSFLGGSASGASSPSGGGGGGSSPSSTDTLGVQPTADQQKQQKTVSLTIMGSLYETEETKMRLVEMVREASDATDFRINQVGS